MRIYRPPPFYPHATFESEVPAALLEDLCRAIVGAYSDAFAFCQDEFPMAQRHDLLPVYRRARIEQSVAAMAGRHPDVAATACRNDARNSYHERLQVGRFILTVHAVGSDDEVVREAKHRRGYARDAQLDLFARDEPPPPDAPIYAVVLHVPSSDQRGPVGVGVCFPNMEFSGYVGERIDLRARFPQVFGAAETIPMPLAPPLRTVEQAKGE